MTVTDAIKYSTRKRGLSWFKNKLKSNIGICNIALNGLNVDLDNLYIGHRVEDSGFVIGYLLDNGNILDIGLIATWWCNGVRQLETMDLEVCKKYMSKQSYQPFFSREAVAL